MKRSRPASDIARSGPKKQSRLTNRRGEASSFTLSRYSGISNPINDRSSLFQAFFFPIPSHSQSDVDRMVLQFRASEYCYHADHAMYAYRLQSLTEQKPRCGQDDDGERFAGNKLADLLSSMNAFGLVICIREYGGVMLGPVRFQHIAECAREAIMGHRNAISLDRMESERLRRRLVARDMTIVALRKLLDGEALLSSQRSNALSGDNTGVNTEQRPISNTYEGQDLVTLSRLLDARDKTVQALRYALQSTTAIAD